MADYGEAGKGDTRRPRAVHISEEEYGLRWALAFGEITREEFDKQIARLQEMASHRRK